MNDNCVRCGKAKDEHVLAVGSLFCPSAGRYLAPEPEPKVIFEAKSVDGWSGILVFDSGEARRPDAPDVCSPPIPPPVRCLAAELARLWRRVQELEGK